MSYLEREFLETTDTINQSNESIPLKKVNHIVLEYINL